MYSIIKTGGKQYRVEEGQTLLVERLPVDEGAQVTLQPLLYVDGDEVFDGDDLASVTVQAMVVAHERGPKLRIVKFKPKRGYKRRTGHRQELTRVRVTGIEREGSKPRGAPTKPTAAPVAAESASMPNPAQPASPEPAVTDTHEEASNGS